MQFKLVCVLVALFTYQGLNVSATPTSETYDTRGLVDVIKASIRQLQGLVEIAIDSAFDVIDIALEKAIGLSQGITNEAMKQVRAIIQIVVNNMQELKDTAAGIGVNITECLIEPEKDLFDLPELAQEHVEVCLDLVCDQLREIAAQGKVETNKTLAIIDVLLDKLDACGSDIFCLIALSTECGKAVIQIPLQIAGSAAKIAASITHAGLDLGKCGVSIGLNVTRDTAEIFDGFYECYKDKMNQALVAN